MFLAEVQVEVAELCDIAARYGADAWHDRVRRGDFALCALRFALKGRILRQVCTAESHGPVLPTLGLAGEGSGAGTRAKPLAGRILQPPQQDGSVACLKSSYVESHAPFVPCHAAAGAQNCSRKVPGRQPILEVSSIA